MNLVDVNALVGPRQARKRVGRGAGSGLGSECGRGTKGAKSRSGFKNRFYSEGGQMPLARRVPKRGFSNYLFKERMEVVNLDSLNSFPEGTEITRELLVSAGLVRSDLPVKLLGRGTLNHKLNVCVHRVSASARAQIEAKGGSIRLLPTRKDSWEIKRLEKIRGLRQARADRKLARKA